MSSGDRPTRERMVLLSIQLLCLGWRCRPSTRGGRAVADCGAGRDGQTPESFTTEMRYSATVKELQKVDLSFKVAGTVQEFYQVPDPNSAQTRDVQVGDAVPSECRAGASWTMRIIRRKWNAAPEQLAKAESQRVAAARGCGSGGQGPEAGRGVDGQGGRHAGESGRGEAPPHHGGCGVGSRANGTWRRRGSRSSRPRTIWTTAPDRPADGPGVRGRKVRGTQRASGARPRARSC